jgi:hypothetical protein
MAGKKIKLDEQVISEILVADSDSESGSEASNLEVSFEEEEEERDQQQQQQASAEIETQAATSGGLPTCGPHQGLNTNIHPFVGPTERMKKVRLHTSTKTARHSLCCCFSQKCFICWLNRQTCTTTNS